MVCIFTFDVRMKVIFEYLVLSAVYILLSQGKTYLFIEACLHE